MFVIGAGLNVNHNRQRRAYVICGQLMSKTPGIPSSGLDCTPKRKNGAWRPEIMSTHAQGTDQRLASPLNPCREIMGGLPSYLDACRQPLIPTVGLSQLFFHWPKSFPKPTNNEALLFC